MTVTSLQCSKAFGDPRQEHSLEVLRLDFFHAVNPKIPAKVYCNKLLHNRLLDALTKLYNQGLLGLIQTWDGCFCIRNKRVNTSPSVHSWGGAVDINASHNRLGGTSTQDPRLVEAFVTSGFEWGGSWHNPDPMHFQFINLAPWTRTTNSPVVAKK